MGRDYKNKSKTSHTPRRPYEKERLSHEMEVIGKYGLKNKREVWRVQILLAKLRKAARQLLTLPLKDPRRLFEGTALMRRMYRYGLLNEDENKLDYILGLTVNKLMERRLQTRVQKSGPARSIHQARIMIRHRHIRVGKRMVNIPSFMVRTDSEKGIDTALTSPLGSGRPGRTKRRQIKRQPKEKPVVE